MRQAISRRIIWHNAYLPFKGLTNRVTSRQFSLLPARSDDDAAALCRLELAAGGVSQLGDALEQWLASACRLSQEWAAIGSIAAKIGCTAEPLRGWVRQAERDQGTRPGLSSDERERLKALQRENREQMRSLSADRCCCGRR